MACGFLDACGVGQVLSGCGGDAQGSCTNCAADGFSSSDGTLERLESECRRCEALSCPVGSYRFGCGTAYDALGAPASSSPGTCLECPAGKYTPANTPYHACAECPQQDCQGAPGEVYLEGCYARDSGVCKPVVCSVVAARALCSLPVQPKLAGAIKIAAQHGIPELNPSQDTDAFGSALAWISLRAADAGSASPTAHASALLSNVLAVGAARDTSAAASGTSASWRLGSVYLLRIQPVVLPATPPAVPLHRAGPSDVQVLAKLDTSACGLPPSNGDDFGIVERLSDILIA